VLVPKGFEQQTCAELENARVRRRGRRAAFGGTEMSPLGRPPPFGLPKKVESRPPPALPRVSRSYSPGCTCRPGGREVSPCAPLLVRCSWVPVQAQSVTQMLASRSTKMPGREQHARAEALQQGPRNRNENGVEVGAGAVFVRSARRPRYCAVLVDVDGAGRAPGPAGRHFGPAFDGAVRIGEIVDGSGAGRGRLRGALGNRSQRKQERVSHGKKLLQSWPLPREGRRARGRKRASQPRRGPASDLEIIDSSI
jgi:hypothetical protein